MTLSLVPTSLGWPVLDLPGADAAAAPAARPRASDREVRGEREVVLAAQAGAAEAFAQLVRWHQRRAYAVARAIVTSHDDAEDAVQDGFLHAYRALDRFRPEQAFGSWLYRIVANAALDLVRRRKVRDADELHDTVSLPFRDPAEDADLRERLRAALATLGERQRSVLVLHDVEGFKHAEIGELLGIPEGTARSDLHHARAALRIKLGIAWSDR
ncbi:MAG TPA: sigma-70 family RNA polymerase sigma factor [Gemmatimonadaceae bacterium]|nr:sigma-70 family RNA polymerase sigma factor [Gemmatimonadaceae bacterium]